MGDGPDRLRRGHRGRRPPGGTPAAAGAARPGAGEGDLVGARRTRRAGRGGPGGGRPRGAGGDRPAGAGGPAGGHRRAGRPGRRGLRDPRLPVPSRTRPAGTRPPPSAEGTTPTTPAGSPSRRSARSPAPRAWWRRSPPGRSCPGPNPLARRPSDRSTLQQVGATSEGAPRSRTRSEVVDMAAATVLGTATALQAGHYLHLGVFSISLANAAGDRGDAGDVRGRDPAAVPALRLPERAERADRRRGPAVTAVARGAVSSADEPSRHSWTVAVRGA